MQNKRKIEGGGDLALRRGEFSVKTYTIVYYVPRRIMRVITRRATMLAGDRSEGVVEA